MAENAVPDAVTLQQFGKNRFICSVIKRRTMPLSTAVKDCAWRLHWKLPDKPATAIS